MNTRDLAENKLDDAIYISPNSTKVKWILAMGVLFIFTFLLYFPFENKIKMALQSALLSNPNCPIQYNDLKLNYFLPKIELRHVKVPGRCLGPGRPSLGLKNVLIYFKGFSISPLGISLSLKTAFKQSPLHLRVSASQSQQNIRIEETTLQLENLSEYFALPIKLSGKVKTQALFEIKNGKLKEGNILLKSGDLNFPTQSINRFSISQLTLGQFLLKGTFVGETGFKLHNLLLGNPKKEGSPIIANLKGSMRIFPNNMMTSAIDIKGDLKFSQKFTDQYGFILSAVLSGVKQANGSYQLHLGGTLGHPKLL